MSMRRSAFVLTLMGLAAGGACGCSGGSQGSPGGTGGGGTGGAQTSGTATTATSGSAGTGGAGTSTSTGGGSGSTGSGGTIGDCFDYTGWNGSAPVATFKADVLPIFRASCSDTTSCHGSENNPNPTQHFYGTPTSAGAMTTAQIAAVFAGAVGRASVAEPDLDVIAAGSPEKSFMTYKLDATSAVDCSVLECAAGMACGSPMPLGVGPLSAASRDAIRRWIAQGAKND